MTFLYPLGLLGLMALPVIVALHLWRERRQRYAVSSLHLWKQVPVEASHSRPTRLPITWLLLLDLMIAALLSLAWAQPQFQSNWSPTPARQVVIVIDVSTSMRARSGVTTRFDQAKSAAATLLSGLGPGDSATVVAFADGAHLVGDTRQVGISALAERVAYLNPGETGHDLSAALALGQAAVQPDLPAEFHILTDGAFADPGDAIVRSFAYPLRWRLAGEAQDNQAVLALNAVLTSGNTLEVFTRVANFGSAQAQRTIVLQVDGQDAAQADLTIPPNASVPQSWTLKVTPAFQSPTVAVRLEGQDALAEDDYAFAAISASAGSALPGSGKLRVLLVAANPSPLVQAFHALPQVELTVIAPQDYALRLAQVDRSPDDLTVLRGFLPTQLPNGLVLVVDPPQGDGILSAQGKRDIPPGALLQLQANDPLLASVDLSGIRWGRAFHLTALPAGFVSVVQAGDAPLLVRGDVQDGATHVAALLADLDKGDLSRTPAFPILIGNLVNSIHADLLPPSLLSGQVVDLPPAGSYTEIQITPPQGDPLILNAGSSLEWKGTLDPGLYTFEMKDSQGKTLRAVTGVNAGESDESDLRPRPWSQALLDATSGATAPLNEGVLTAAGRQRLDPVPLSLTPALLALALASLILEASLAWRSSS